MKMFFRKFAILTLLLASICFVCFFTIRQVLNSPKLYTLPVTKSRLLLGDSHTTCIADSLLDSTLNLSMPADAFAYSYGKLCHILPNNPQVHTVILSCSEIVINQENIDVWFTNSFISEKIHRYFQFLTFDQVYYLFQQNPEQVTKDIFHIPVAKILFCAKILTSNKVGMKDLDLGGYLNLNKQVDINKALAELQEAEKTGTHPTSGFQVKYLHKIADLCKQRHVKLLLLRTPEYKYNLYTKKNEALFLQLMHTEFADVPFVDLVNMHLPDSCFYDLDHVNHHGEKLLADTLNSIVAQYNH